MSDLSNLDSDGLEILAAYTEARIAGKPMHIACGEAYYAGRDLPSFRHLRAPCWNEQIAANSGGKGPRSYKCPLARMMNACGADMYGGEFGSHSAAYPRTKRSLEAAAAAESKVCADMEAMHLAFLATRFAHMGFAA